MKPVSDALAAYGWTADVESRIRKLAPHEMAARVVRVDRGACDIATISGIARCKLGPRDSLVPGDWVIVEVDPSAQFVLTERVERTTEIQRVDATGTGNQTLAVNVDVMFALHGVDRPHRVGRLERLSILAWEAGVEPVVVITKIDLVDQGESVISVDDAKAEVAAMLADVPIHAVSSMTGEGLDELTQYLGPGASVALAGESGCGKSTLVNALVGDAVAPTGRTRSGDSKGRHTTTWRELIPLGNGAVVVDMPGIRTIGVTSESAGTERAYEDIAELALSCRFRDCGHSNEPGCAVRAAREEGTLSEARWTSYTKLNREHAAESDRAFERQQKGEARELIRKKRAEEPEAPRR